MRLLLLGPSGQVGWELQRALAPLGEVIALGRAGHEGLCGDLTRPDELAETVRALSPQVIVNAAAYTGVDQAESEPALAHAVNAEAPAVLAGEAQRADAWLVHYSTDYVFDGSGERPWRETDPTGPLNVYGASKLAGEQAIRESACRALILRSSWVYAARGSNFLRTMLRLARERDALRVVDDQVGAPTGAELIADVTAHLLAAVRREPGRAGTYHLAAAGNVSWHGYARFVIARARALGWPVRVADAAVEAVATEAFPTAAARPRNSRLDCGLLERTFGLRMPDWRDGVARVVSTLIEPHPDRVTT